MNVWINFKVFKL